MKRHIFLMEDVSQITLGDLKKIAYENSLPDSTVLVFGTQEKKTVTFSPWDNSLYFSDSRWVKHHMGKKIDRI